MPKHDLLSVITGRTGDAVEWPHPGYQNPMLAERAELCEAVWDGLRSFPNEPPRHWSGSPNGYARTDGDLRGCGAPASTELAWRWAGAMEAWIRSARRLTYVDAWSLLGECRRLVKSPTTTSEVHEHLVDFWDLEPTYREIVDGALAIERVRDSALAMLDECMPSLADVNDLGDLTRVAMTCGMGPYEIEGLLGEALRPDDTAKRVAFRTEIDADGHVEHFGAATPVPPPPMSGHYVLQSGHEVIWEEATDGDRFTLLDGAGMICVAYDGIDWRCPQAGGAHISVQRARDGRLLATVDNHTDVLETSRGVPVERSVEDDGDELRVKGTVTAGEPERTTDQSAGPGDDRSFSTIATALATAAPGDTIRVFEQAAGYQEDPPRGKVVKGSASMTINGQDIQILGMDDIDQAMADAARSAADRGGHGNRWLCEPFEVSAEDLERAGKTFGELSQRLQETMAAEISKASRLPLQFLNVDTPFVADEENTTVAIGTGDIDDVECAVTMTLPGLVGDDLVCDCGRRHVDVGDLSHLSCPCGLWYSRRPGDSELRATTAVVHAGQVYAVGQTEEVLVCGAEATLNLPAASLKRRLVVKAPDGGVKVEAFGYDRIRLGSSAASLGTSSFVIVEPGIWDVCTVGGEWRAVQRP